MSIRRRKSKTPRCSAVVVAAGRSSRMGGKVRKPYLKLRGKPILSWTLAALGRVKGLRQIVVVTRPDDRRRAKRAFELAQLPKRVKLTFAEGGPRRQDSVRNGLRATDPESELVLIHDAARPFPPQAGIAQAIHAAARNGAAILAVRVRDTVKKERRGKNLAAHTVATTLARDGLWLAQTPQVFRRALILECSERLAQHAPRVELTDDAAVLEHFKKPVALIESSPANLKITRREDLAIAEAFLRTRGAR